MARAIAACRSCAAGATASARRPAAVLPARLDAGGYERTAEHVARLARVDWSPDGGEPAATVAVPGGSVAVLPSEAVDLGADRARGSRSGAHWLDAEIARAEKQAGQRELRRQGAPRPSSQAERDKLAQLREERAGL